MKLEPIPCPCCKHPISAPDVEIVIDHFRLPPMQAAVLRAVWRGKGMPVMPERIFNVIYADDPDGGPSPGTMYRNFKVTLCHLRKRLAGTGIAIENVGYAQGYRLSMELN